MLVLVFKDLKLFFTDKRSVLLTFLLPIALITMFAYAFGGAGKDSHNNKEYELPICDLDNSDASKKAITELDSLKSIHIVKYAALNTAQEAIKKGKINAVLILHKGFSDSIANGNAMPVELQYDEAKEMEISMLQQSLFQTFIQIKYSSMGSSNKPMLKMFDKMIGNSDKKTKEKVHSQFDSLYSSSGKGMEQEPDRTKAKTNNNSFLNYMGTDIKMTKLLKADNDNVLGLIQAVAGTAIMMLLFSVTGMGASLLDEKQEGTLKKILYSPVYPINILFGKMIFTNLISIFQLIVMFIYAYIVFQLDIFQNLFALITMIVFTAYACSSFGVLLASVAKSRQQVQGLSSLIILVMSCIGGSMIPTFIMPIFMQKISVFSVNYWGIQGFYDIFWRKLPISDITFLSRIAMLFIIGTTLNIIAFKMFKKNILNII